MTDEIGFIGVGNMGQPMAANLLEAGQRLVVHDISEAAMAPLLERQARKAGSPREVAEACELVFVSLPNNRVIEEIVLGGDGIVQGDKVRLYISTCTTGSAFAEATAAALAEKGITTIDAPISGGPPGARAGTLSIMVSGPMAAFEEARPLLEKLGRKVVHCGDRPGHAQVLKLANNILSATALVASCEALAMGVKAGLDPTVMLEAINAGSGRNSATEDKIPRDVTPRSFAYGAPMHILLKDIDLAVAEGERLGVSQFVCQQVRQVFKLVEHQGWRDRDITEIAKLIEGWAGVEIKAGA